MFQQLTQIVEAGQQYLALFEKQTSLVNKHLSGNICEEIKNACAFTGTEKWQSM